MDDEERELFGFDRETAELLVTMIGDIALLDFEAGRVPQGVMVRKEPEEKVEWARDGF